MPIKTCFPVLVALVAVNSAFAAAAAPPPATAQAAAPRVKIETSLGSFVVRLEPARAPITVKNFLDYVNSGFYDGTIFHRVIPGFVIQGGGYTADYRKKPTRAPIRDEAANGLSNLRGTIAMARERAPDTATSQFYINLADNPKLDFGFPDRPGYAVFGKVVAGMAVVDKIARVPTGSRGPFLKDAPLTSVVIEKIVLLAP